MSADDAKLFWPIGLVAVLAVLIFSVWAGLRNWDECRATPHTVFYCLTAGGK